MLDVVHPPTMWLDSAIIKVAAMDKLENTILYTISFFDLIVHHSQSD